MSIENRLKIPVPRRFFLWSINESSGEVLTHVGPTEFTPSANDRIVRANDRGGFEQPPQMEARPFIVVRDGEYVVLSNPIRNEGSEETPNGAYLPGGKSPMDLFGQLLRGTPLDRTRRGMLGRSADGAPNGEAGGDGEGNGSAE